MASLLTGNKPDLEGYATLLDILQARALKTPDALAFGYLQNGERISATWTFRQLDERAKAIAWRLRRDHAVGSRALLLYPSGLDFVAAFFGCLYAGIVAVPAYPPKTNHHNARLQEIIHNSGASIILTHTAQSGKLARMMEETPMGASWLLTDEVDPGEALYWQQLEVNRDTLAFLQYTSGSTGAPKGVMITHGNLLHNLQMLKHAYALDETTRVLSWLPLYHDMGLVGKVLVSVYCGSTCYLMSPLDFLQRPRRWLQAVSDLGIYFCAAPNFAYDLCVRKIKPEELRQLDLSRWKIAANGAEPVRADTVRAFRERFAECGLSASAMSPGFGMAEATLVISWRQRGEVAPLISLDPEALRQGIAQEAGPEVARPVELVGCGQAYGWQTICIVDPASLERLDDDAVGEIWVRGPSIAHSGYWRNEEASRHTFHRHRPTSESHAAELPEGCYLRTGDLGFMRDGELYVTGRLKDVLIFRGENHYPQDIEHTVRHAHPALTEGQCAAFSIWQDLEEKLVVAVELDRGYRLTEELDAEEPPSHKNLVLRQQLEEAATRAVALEHDLRLHALVLAKRGGIPLTSSGKIQRRACKQKWLDNSLNLANTRRKEHE